MNDLTLADARAERDALADRTDVLDKVGVLRTLPDDMHVTTPMRFYGDPANLIAPQARQIALFPRRGGMKRCHTTADEVIAVAREKKVTPVAALIAEGFVDIADVMMALPVIFGCDVIVRPVKAVPA